MVIAERLIPLAQLPQSLSQEFLQNRLKSARMSDDLPIGGNCAMMATDASVSRSLLERIAAFRQRLESVRALNPEELLHENRNGSSLVSQVREFRHRLHQNFGSSDVVEGTRPPQLTDRARRLLGQARQLLDRQRAIAADPIFGLNFDNSPDPLLNYHRETIAVSDSAIRMAQSFSNSASDQLKQCEGLEGLLGVVQERLTVQERTLGRRRTDADRIDRLAAVYASLHNGSPVALTTVASLAEELLEDARVPRPLRFLQTSLDSVSSYPGSAEFPAPLRHLATHAINVAQVISRIVPFNAEWSARPLLAVVGALLIDCGMTVVPVAVLAKRDGLTHEERRLVDSHAQAGTDMILHSFPEIAPLAAAVGSHHERTDGTGYPGGLRDTAIPSLARLFAVADVYAALNEERTYHTVRDSRASLTEILLMTEHGSFDPECTAALLRLSFYPVGSVVELTDGRVGVVVANHSPSLDPRTAGRPVVAVLTNPDETLLPHPEHIDLATATRGGILRSVPLEYRRKLLGNRYPDLF